MPAPARTAGRRGERAPAAVAGVQPHIAALCGRLAPRAGSLAVTLFGDTIACHGESVWLGSLVAAMAHFGLNARQSRTAVFRLGQEGWLTARASGRRSYYRFSADGQRQYARAAERIYARCDAPWDGHWTLVTTGIAPVAVRDELRRRLGWLGFGALGSGLFAHPRASHEALQEALAALALRDEVVVWRATALAAAPLAALARSSWQLEQLAARHAAFVATFAPLAEQADRLAPLDAFVLRTLVIHEYRRILLRSTDLPAEFLPQPWPGHAARDLCARLYHALYAAATAWARGALHNETGALPAAETRARARFGGLAVVGMVRS